MLDLSVIILSYNTKDLMLQTLQSLVDAQSEWEKKGLKVEVIISDNGSTDGVVEEIKKKYSQFKLIENNDNLGFSAGNNVGARVAKGRYVLFLNNDTVVPPETLPEMVKYMDNHPDVGIATCRIDLWSGGLDKDCRRGFPTPWNALVFFFLKLDRLFPKSRLFGGYRYTYLPDNIEHEIDACLGAFLMVRREIGEKLHWWDEDYIFYGEDIDFCYRVKELGYKVMYYPKVRIIHYKGAASGTKKASKKVTKAHKKTKEWVRAQSVKSMETFYKKHYVNKYPKIITGVVLLGVKLLGFYRIWRVRLFDS